MKADELLKDNSTDVVDKWEKLARGENLLPSYYAQKMHQLLELKEFDGAIMNQVLDHIRISEDGHITIAFLEVTEVEL